MNFPWEISATTKVKVVQKSESSSWRKWKDEDLFVDCWNLRVDWIKVWLPWGRSPPRMTFLQGHSTFSWRDLQSLSLFSFLCSNTKLSWWKSFEVVPNKVVATDSEMTPFISVNNNVTLWLISFSNTQKDLLRGKVSFIFLLSLKNQFCVLKNAVTELLLNGKKIYSNGPSSI